MIAASLSTLLRIFMAWSLSCEGFKLAQPGKNEPLKIHHHMTKREIQKYFGVDTHEEVPEYDVTSPFQADESGNFLSYKLHEHARRRRDADEPSVWYYHMEAFGMSLHLNLTKNTNVLAPGMVVQTVNKNGSTEYSKPPHTAFYDGHVTSDPNSKVAIGNHDGLKGMITYMGSSFLMQPLASHLAKQHGSSEGSRPHLIYRRSLDDIRNECQLLETRSKRSSPMETEVGNTLPREMMFAPHKHLEAMLVADHLYLQKFQNDQEAIDLLLTLAHIVNSLYHDQSVGDIKLKISVVRIALLHSSLSYTDIDDNGARLAAVETWVQGEGNMPSSDAEPEHADQVMLITGKTSGGLAVLGSTCSGLGASVSNGDLGLGSAFILAHESAHALGAGHDSVSKPNCPDGRFIMAVAVPGGKDAFRWSPCSKAEIQSFLGGTSSSCLDDNPDSPITISNASHFKLPGQVYDGDAQCAQQYGTEYELCTKKEFECGSLYCTQDGYRCKSNVVPPADGTKCGERMWCIKGECVDDGSPMIDGGWSDWSDYGKCSYSCGGGVQYKTRNCTNPSPQNGGMPCEGESKGHWRICNPEACPEGTLTHREQQCKDILPGSTPAQKSDRDPCELLCKVKRSLYPRGDVMDGTRCSLDRSIKDVCIEGKCRPVGCDNVLESGIKEDRCKVCNGDSTTCKIVLGRILRPCDGTCTILDVPVGATNVTVSEEVEDWNFLGVKDEDGKNVYPVGYTWSTTKEAAGTKVYYTHVKNEDTDKVYIPGPTNQRLNVYYLRYVARQPVDYSLNEPVGDELHPKVGPSIWHVSEWSACSHACAGGIKTRKVECVLKEDLSYLNDAVCAKLSVKPATQQDCNQSCAPAWYVSGWRPCSRTCGKGVQTRQVVCRQEVTRGKYKTVSDSKCSGAKPTDPKSQDCNKIDCPTEYIPGEWSECSTTCEKGTKTRTKSCQQLKETGVFQSVPDAFCATAIAPPQKEACNQDVLCPENRQYVPLGCFRDRKDDKALPIQVENFRGNGINWKDMSQTVKRCALATAKKYPKLKVFALQFYGECYSGYNGLETYSKHGQVPYSDDINTYCWSGVGGPGFNFVYKFEKYNG